MECATQRKLRAADGQTQAVVPQLLSPRPPVLRAGLLCDCGTSVPEAGRDARGAGRLNAA